MFSPRWSFLACYTSIHYLETPAAVTIHFLYVWLNFPFVTNPLRPKQCWRRLTSFVQCNKCTQLSRMPLAPLLSILHCFSLSSFLVLLYHCNFTPLSLPMLPPFCLTPYFFIPSLPPPFLLLLFPSYSTFILTLHFLISTFRLSFLSSTIFSIPLFDPRFPSDLLTYQPPLPSLPFLLHFSIHSTSFLPSQFSLLSSFPP